MSTADLHQRASAVFLHVRTLPAHQRSGAIADAVGDDQALRGEVLSLLQHDGGDEPATFAPTVDELTPANDWSRVGRTSPAKMPDAPKSIGPYRIIERIGRGGSGFVLLAEQDEPVRRRVAIKIVPHAAISPEFAARFEVERRALERTDHPNIARILDAGRTGDGLPYLVMDYVQGVSITEHCRRKSVPMRGRIDLMLAVADAVQHAHQRGVIHRDLKPGNILVSESDAHAVPHVLDFGIAKPVNEGWGGGDRAQPTAGMPLGTPAYMSPEQTGRTGAAIDTRADVYALGAVLYELACGRPPIETSDDLMDSLRRIRETMPAPVSRVRAENNAMFSGDPAPRWLLHDLDCILARALEKEPDRRYPTAAAFADDLRRLLKREPIIARPPTLRYRAARFAQRNRALVASAVIVSLAVIAGIAGLTWGLFEANRQRLEAVNQTESQREINRFLTDDLLAPASPDQQGQNVTALELLNRASAQVDQRFFGRPIIAGSVHHTLGVAYSALGEYEKADAHLKKAIELRTAAQGANAPDTVRSEIAAASLLGLRQQLAEADAALTQVLARARLLLGSNDPALFQAVNDLGVVRDTQGRSAEAVPLLEEAVAGRVRLLGPRDPLVLASTSNLAVAYDSSGQPEKSLHMLLEALHIAEKIEPPPRMALMELNNNIGATYQDLNRDTEAVPYLKKAAELATNFLGDEHPATLTISSNLAGLEAELGDSAAAAKLLEHVIKVRTRMLGPRAFDTLTARYAYWNALFKGKRFNDCAEGYLAMLPDAVTTLGESHWFVVQTRAALALALLDADRLAEALPHAEKAVAQFTALYGSKHERTINAAKTLSQVRAGLASGESATAPSAVGEAPSPQ